MQRISPKSLESVLNFLDPDNDGNISLEELEEAFRLARTIRAHEILHGGADDPHYKGTANKVVKSNPSWLAEHGAKLLAEEAGTTFK